MAKDRQQSRTMETPGEAQRHSGEVAEQTGGSEGTKAQGSHTAKSQPQGGTSGRDAMNREKEQPEKQRKEQSQKKEHPLLGKQTEVRQGEPAKTEPSKTKKPAA